MNYERQFQSMKNKDNNLEKISSEKYLIIGNQCNPVDKKEKSNFEILEDKLNLKLDNSISMILPEVDLEKYKENISINKILELYNSIIIGSRIFPAYLQTAIVNENEDNLKQSSQYFEVLFSIYKNNSKGDNNSLIYLKINEFVSSFKDMVIKLKNAGVDFKNNNSLD